MSTRPFRCAAPDLSPPVSFWDNFTGRKEPLDRSPCCEAEIIKSDRITWLRSRFDRHLCVLLAIGSKESQANTVIS
jgi:hypothetical protein